MSVAIIGSGVAGLAALDVLVEAGADVHAFEASEEWGGHTRSIVTDGFTFDEGPHVSFTKDERVRELFARGAGDVVELDAIISNRYRDHWIEHPAQCHLHGLDADLVAQCIVDLAEERAQPRAVETYADWCRSSFGNTFAETFPFVYTRKYWTVEAEDMGIDWVGERVYPPSLDDVVRGALAPDHDGRFHYLSTVRYPARGGFQSFLDAFARPEHVETGKRVTTVDPWDRRLTFADETEAGYDSLISTMPLPELIAAIDATRVPSEVHEAAEALLCSSVVLVDIAVNRADLSAFHWFYSYDEDVSFSRAAFPHKFAAANAPAGKGSIQVEVYHSRHRPLPCSREALPDRVVDELIAMGVLRSRDEVLWARHRDVRYANVVFDHARQPALDTLLPWVADLGIVLAGRYGEWAYLWTDGAARSGWAAAASVLGESQPAHVS